MGKPFLLPEGWDYSDLILLILEFLGGPLGLLFTIFCTIVGLVLVFKGGSELSSIRASLDWTRVDGEIVTSDISEYMTETKDDRGRRIRVENELLKFAYRFTVKGKEFTASRVSFGGGLELTDYKAAVKKYPVGKKVAVHHDPENPSEAVLVPGGDQLKYTIWVKMGIVFLVIGWTVFPIVNILIMLLARTS